MKTQIAYYSRTGNSATLAHGIAKSIHHSDISLVNLNDEAISRDASMYVLCFGMTKGEIPIHIIDALDRMEGKDILLMVTCGKEPTDEYRRYIMRRIEPFLPETGECLDVFLCRGAFPEEVYNHITEKHQEAPDNDRLQQAMLDCQNACGHPNQNDINAATDFLKKHLRLPDLRP